MLQKTPKKYFQKEKVYSSPRFSGIYSATKTRDLRAVRDPSILGNFPSIFQSRYAEFRGIRVLQKKPKKYFERGKVYSSLRFPGIYSVMKTRDLRAVVRSFNLRQFFSIFPVMLC